MLTLEPNMLAREASQHTAHFQLPRQPVWPWPWASCWKEGCATRGSLKLHISLRNSHCLIKGDRFRNRGQLNTVELIPLVSYTEITNMGRGQKPAFSPNTESEGDKYTWLQSRPS